ncbi:MAG: family 16 glycoside hydrolase [Anaerolineae bacterium]
MEERKCSSCGTSAASNDRFCQNCGQALADQPGAAASGAFVPPPPPPPAPDAPITSDATMMAFVPPPAVAQGAFTPPPSTAGSTAFIPPPESAVPAPTRQEPVVPPPPSVLPPQDGTLMSPTTPPPAVVTPPPARQPSVFGQPPSSTPPPAKPAGVFSQPPTSAPVSAAPRAPYRPPRRSMPPAQPLTPSSQPPKKSNTGLIIGGCAALAVILIGIVLIVIFAVLPAINRETGIVTPVAKSTQAVKASSKTATPSAKNVTKSPSPKTAATKSGEIKAAIATGALLYSEDFSDTSSGWDAWKTTSSQVGYVGGEYVIEVLKVDSFYWANPGQDFSDFVFEVDATKQDGPDDNSFGVILRYVDENNFYRFDISSDGYYAFGYYENDEWISLIDWTEATAIKQGDATNTITILCKGSKFTLYVNGTKLTDVTDATFSSGDVGLWAGAFTEARVTIAFDRLGVWKTR